MATVTEAEAWAAVMATGTEAGAWEAVMATGTWEAVLPAPIAQRRHGGADVARAGGLTGRAGAHAQPQPQPQPWTAAGPKATGRQRQQVSLAGGHRREMTGERTPSGGAHVLV